MRGKLDIQDPQRPQIGPVLWGQIPYPPSHSEWRSPGASLQAGWVRMTPELVGAHYSRLASTFAKWRGRHCQASLPPWLARRSDHPA